MSLSNFEIVDEPPVYNKLGVPAKWIFHFFPDFPPVGLPVPQWSRKQRVDFLISHSITVTPYRLTNFSLLEAVQLYYYYPRFFPPDLYLYLAGNVWSSREYRSDRHAATEYQAVVEQEDPEEPMDWKIVPEWIQKYLPNYPYPRGLPEYWDAKTLSDFLKAWNVDGLIELFERLDTEREFLELGFDDQLEDFPTVVPVHIRNVALNMEYVDEMEMLNVDERTAWYGARAANQVGDMARIGFHFIEVASHDMTHHECIEMAVHFGKMFYNLS